MTDQRPPIVTEVTCPHDCKFYHGSVGVYYSPTVSLELKDKWNYILLRWYSAQGATFTGEDLAPDFLETIKEEKTKKPLLIVILRCISWQAPATLPQFWSIISDPARADGLECRSHGQQCKDAGHKDWVIEDEEAVGSSCLDGNMQQAPLVNDLDALERDDLVSPTEAAAIKKKIEDAISEDKKKEYTIALKEVIAKDRDNKMVDVDISPVPNRADRIFRGIWNSPLASIISIFTTLSPAFTSPEDRSYLIHALLLEAIRANRPRLVQYFLSQGARFTTFPFNLEESNRYSSDPSIEIDPRAHEEWHVCVCNATPTLLAILLDPSVNWQGIHASQAKKDSTLHDMFYFLSSPRHRLANVRFLLRHGAQPRKVQAIWDTATLALAAGHSYELLEACLFGGATEAEYVTANRDRMPQAKEEVRLTMEGTGAVHRAMRATDLEGIWLLHRWGADLDEVPTTDPLDDPKECRNGPVLHGLINELGDLAWRMRGPSTVANEKAKVEDEQRAQRLIKVFQGLLEMGADPGSGTVWMRDRNRMTVRNLVEGLEVEAWKTQLREILELWVTEEDGEAEANT